MSTTENAFYGTVPSVIAAHPLRGRLPNREVKPTPGDGGGDPAVTDKEAAAAKISSRTESEEDMMRRVKAKELKRKFNTMRRKRIKSLDVRSEGINLDSTESVVRKGS